MKYSNRTVRFIKHIAKTSFSISAPFTVEKITNFIDKHFYNLQSCDKTTLKRVMTVEPASIIFIHDDPSLQANIEFRVAAEEISQEILAVTTPLTLDKHMKKFIRFLGVGPKFNVSLPVLRIIERGADERVRKYKYEGEITRDTIKNFYNEWKSGLLKPYFKSQAIPESNKGIVKEIVGQNFDEIVLDRMKDVVVFYYSIWCIECGDHLLNFEKIAEKYSHLEDLLFVKIDSYENEGELVPEAYDGEPYMRIFRADDGERFIEFEDEFVYTEMEQFVSKNLRLAGNGDL